jgi:hypothetical protein
MLQQQALDRQAKEPASKDIDVSGGDPDSPGRGPPKHPYW